MIYKNKYIQYLIIILFSSCSFYSFKGSLPPGINSIYFSQVSNLTSEYTLTNMLNEKINNKLIIENILDVVNFSNADSQLDLIVTSIKDSPNVYKSQNNNYELVEQWKLSKTLLFLKKNYQNGLCIIMQVLTSAAMALIMMMIHILIVRIQMNLDHQEKPVLE